MSRIVNWTKMNSLELWQHWRALHPSDELALAAAVWTCNRLVKSNYCRHTRRSFYEVKDIWIRDHQSQLMRGRITREEIKQCFRCGGTGEYSYYSYDDEYENDDYPYEDEECDRCGGTGIWERRVLYLHEFLIEGMPFKFHSYINPVRLDEEHAEDAEHFGRAFTEQEEKALPLPLSGVLQMLRWRAFTLVPMNETGEGT